jgi:hypothetical protein
MSSVFGETHVVAVLRVLLVYLFTDGYFLQFSIFIAFVISGLGVTSRALLFNEWTNFKEMV